MSKASETRHIKQNETCKCKCRLDAGVCDIKQRWNDDKCLCECKEMVDKGVSDERLFGILATVNANAINHVMLENIQILKILGAGKNQLIN